MHNKYNQYDSSLQLTKKASFILLVDFRKAFDSINHSYIHNCLKLYGFWESIRWVTLFFNKREAFILLGGNLRKKSFGTGCSTGRCNKSLFLSLKCWNNILKNQLYKTFKGSKVCKERSQEWIIRRLFIRLPWERREKPQKLR